MSTLSMHAPSSDMLPSQQPTAWPNIYLCCLWVCFRDCLQSGCHTASTTIHAHPSPIMENDASDLTYNFNSSIYIPQVYTYQVCTYHKHQHFRWESGGLSFPYLPVLVVNFKECENKQRGRGGWDRMDSSDPKEHGTVLNQSQSIHAITYHTCVRRFLQRSNSAQHSIIRSTVREQALVIPIVARWYIQSLKHCRQ